MIDNDMSKYRTVAQASKLLGLTPQTIRNYISNGKIRAMKSGYHVRIHLNEINRLLDERRLEPKTVDRFDSSPQVKPPSIGDNSNNSPANA